MPKKVREVEIDTTANEATAEVADNKVTGPACSVCGLTEFNSTDGVIAMVGPDSKGYCFACDTQVFTLDGLRRPFAADAPEGGLLGAVLANVVAPTAAVEADVETAAADEVDVEIPADYVAAPSDN